MGIVWVVVFLCLWHIPILTVGEAKCRSVVPVTNLDVDKFFTGKWFEIKRAPGNQKESVNCGVFEFITDDTHITLDYTSEGHKSSHAVQIFSNSTFTSTSHSSTESQFYILGTDYDFFAVVYGCSKLSAIKETFWILSRHEYIPFNGEKIADDIFESYGLSGRQMESCKNNAPKKAVTECFAVTPQKGLFGDRFFNWRFLEVSRTANDFDIGASCGTFWYEHVPAFPSDPLQNQMVVLDQRYPESKYDFIMFGNATTQNDILSADIQFPNEQIISKYYILRDALDYSFVYACGKDGAQVKEVAWVLAGQTRNLTAEIWADIDQLIDFQSQQAGEDFRVRLQNAGFKTCKIDTSQ